MGQGNAAVKQWMSNPNRFADLFNATVFQGEQIVLPEELEPAETETDLLVTDKNGKIREVQRHRDIVMHWKKGARFVLLACENQQRIHYAMPVRSMLYDSLSYTAQIKQMHQEKQKDPNKKMSRDEFLSKFSKTDKICPVITLVLYYGEELWDGSIDLYGMFQSEELLREKEILQQYIPNYRINLVEPGNLEDFEKFQTDLHEIFGMLRYRSNKKKLLEYVQDKETYFRSVDEDTYYVIREFLHSEKVLKVINKAGEEEEKVDMCKALQDLYDEGIEKGIEQGIEKGIKQGIKEGAENERMEIARRLLGVLDIQMIAEKVGLSKEQVIKLKEEM